MVQAVPPPAGILMRSKSLRTDAVVADVAVHRFADVRNRRLEDDEGADRGFFLLSCFFTSSLVAI